MNIKDYLHLFTPVEEGLPEKEGKYVAILNDGKEQWIGVETFIIKDEKKYWWDYILITHWLDLSKLTTKERAVEFAEKAYKEGYEFISVHPKFMKQDREEFINQNKNIL